MERDSFIFYRSFYEASKPLSTEQKADLFDTICTFALNHEDKQNDDPIVNAMFSLIKPQLEANYTRFLNGKKAKQKQNVSKSKANVNVNVNANVNDNVNEKKERSFSAPSLLEVEEEFIRKLGNGNKSLLEAEMFYSFYGSKNWFVGKSKMKNYKMAINGWITRKKLETNERPGKEERIKQLQASTERKFGISL